MPTQQEIQAQQGTRLQEANPWDTYSSEMSQNLSPELAAEVAEYALHRYEDAPVSSQAQEEYARLKESNDEVAQEYQWLKPEEYADFGARVGIVKSHADLLVGLRKANIQCFYRQHPHGDKAVLYVVRNGIEEIGCWVQINGPMPELSIMNFDSNGAPLAERRRGWRTCLLQLILKGVITERKANRIFGKPREDVASHRYNSTLQAFRNAGNNLE